MLPGFATTTITLLRAGETEDAHGNEERDWDTATQTSINWCSVQPGTTAEDAVNRDTTLIAYTVYAPAGTDVTSTDRILFDGKTFEIDGEPERWNVGSAADHTKLFLRRWEG